MKAFRTFCGVLLVMTPPVVAAAQSITASAWAQQPGPAVPVGTVAAAVSVVISLLLSPETKGKVLMAELSVA